MNDKIKAIAKVVASVFLSLLVILCVYTFVMTDILKKDYVNVLGYSYFVVGSGSMSDAIEVNDIVFVKITKDVDINDIVTYKSVDNIIVTHRLISKDKDKYILKGDANNVSDDPILQDQIIGKVNLVVSPMFVLKCIAVFLILFIFLALINFDAIFNKFIAKEKQEENKNDLPKDEKKIKVQEKKIPVIEKKDIIEKRFPSETKKDLVVEKKTPPAEKFEILEEKKPIVEKNETKEVKQIPIVEKIETKEVKQIPTVEKIETKEVKQILVAEKDVPKVEKTEPIIKKNEIKEEIHTEEKPIAEKVDTSKYIEVPKVVSDEIFMSPEKRRNDDAISGLTVTISLDEIENLKRILEQEEARLSDTEILDDIEFLDRREEDDDDDDFNREVDPEKDLMELILSIHKTKNKSIKKSRMNAKWIKKFQYIYRLNLLLLNGKKRDFVQSVEKPSFKEIYDYDLDGAGLTDYVRYKIFDMPVHVYLRVLTYSILYNDDELFDGIFKIFKYRVLLDKNYLYVDIKKMDNHKKACIKSLVKFMKKVPERYDKKEVFELDKIERMIKINSY